MLRTNIVLSNRRCFIHNDLSAMRISNEAPDGPPPCQTPLMNDEGRDSGDNHQNNETEGKLQIEQPQKIPSDVLRRNPYIVLLTLSYAAIALFSWVVQCILSYRPIGVPGGSYTVDYHGSEVDVGTMPRSKLFSLSERYLRAAKVLQPIASILTIPLTSMVCSCAAVAFLQRQPSGGRQGPTLR